MATKTVRRKAELKGKSDETMVVSTPPVIEATTEHLAYGQLARGKRAGLGGAAWRISRAMLGALRIGAKRSSRSPSGRPAARAVGVLPADWEYMTNFSASTQPDFWVHLLVGEGYGSSHRKS